MTAAHAVECHYYEWADFAPLDRWIGVFEQYLLRRAAVQRAVRRDARPFGVPDRAALPPARASAHRRSGRRGRTADRRARPRCRCRSTSALSAASILFNYYNWKTKGDTADELIARVAPWLDDPHANPLQQVWWRVHLAFNHQILGRYAKAQEDHGRSGGDRARARTPLAALRDLLRGDRRRRSARATPPAQRVRSTSCAPCSIRRGGWTSRISASRNRRCAASKAATPKPRTRRPKRSTIGRAAGLPSMQMPHFLVRHATTRLDLDEIDAALALYDEAVALADGVDKRNFSVQRALVRAHARGSTTATTMQSRSCGLRSRRRASIATAASCATRRACWRRCWRSPSRTASSAISCAS